MFGQSISGQIDADNNGYVGKYKIEISSTVMLLYCKVRSKTGVEEF